MAIRFRQLFEDAYDPARVRIVRLEHPVSFYRDLGEHCLANYYADHYPFDGNETVGLEERVSFEMGRLDSGPVRIQGFIEMGYDIYTKPCTHWVKDGLEKRVTPSTAWQRVGKNAEMTAWATTSPEGAMIQLWPI